MRCQNCGALLKDISPAKYAAINVSYDPGISVNDLTAEETLRRLDVQGATNTLTSVFRKFGFAPKDKRLLDIGCGSGRYLVAGQNLGMQAVGVEPSPPHSAAGRKILGLDIRTGYFDKTQFGSDEFDVVVLSHVIEHIFEPRQFLEAAYSLLRPGGMVLMFTPNAANLIAKASKGNWSMLEPVDHVSMFEPRTAKAIAPKGAKTTLWTTEYLWEPVVTLLVAVRNKVRGPKPAPVIAGVTQVEALHGRKPLNALLRAACALLSLPMIAYDRFTLKGACLVAAYQRAAP